MTKIFPVLLVFLTLTGCLERLDKKIIFFDEFEFNSGTYKLYFFGQEGTLIDGYHNFYIDDISTLNEIRMGI